MRRTRRGLAGWRRVFAVVAAIAGLLLVPVTAFAQQTHDVEAQDNEFVPPSNEIQVGDTVRWTNTGNNPHTVTDENGRFDQTIQPGETFTFTYQDDGTLPYYCRFHGGPGGQGMAGTITAQAAAEDEPSPAQTTPDDGDQEPEQTSPPETSEETPEETPEETAPADSEQTSPPSDEGTDGAEDPADPSAVTGTISAQDQTGDGTTVTVDSVEISGSSGFVVVHLDEDGAPGRVLGHAPIPEGSSTNVHVTLDEPLAESATVWPMLHTDQGEVGAYEFPGPDVPVQDDGEIVQLPIRFEVGLAFTGLPDRADVHWLLALSLALMAAGTILVRRRSRAASG